jgi:hypothetical protein
MDMQNAQANEFAGMLESDEMDVEQAAHLVMLDAAALQKSLEGLLAKDDLYRFNCLKVLLHVCETRPQVLLPAWTFLAGLLGSGNAYQRSIGVQLLSYLAEVDDAGRFAAIFDDYFALLDDESLVVARHTARNAGRIAMTRPDLRPIITARLLDIDATHFPQDRKDLIKADVFQAFENYFETSEDQAAMLAFAARNIDCASPKGSQAARDFLDQFTNIQEKP